MFIFANVANFVLGLLMLLAIFPGLWVAGKMLPSFVSRIRDEDIRSTVSRGSGRLIAWLAIGVFVTAPFNSFLSWLMMWVNLFVGERWWGDIMVGSTRIHLGMLLQLAVWPVLFGSVLWYSRSLWKASDRKVQAARFLVVLGATSLTYTVAIWPFSFLQIQIPAFGLLADKIGYLPSGLMGLALLVVAVEVLNKLLFGRIVVQED